MEDSIIEHLRALFPAPAPLLGIGDDCAVIPIDSEKAWLVTADALVEGVHFLKDKIAPLDLGYKTVAVNVSDICAMGGTPKYAFLSIALPKVTSQAWIDAFLQGIKQACEKWNVVLLGGDTVGSKRDLFINLTLIGIGSIGQLKYRHQAKTGDIVCLTGYIGDSSAGLKALQQEIAPTNDVAYLLNAHFRPEPRVQESCWLAAKGQVHAMMDLSDGLDCDLRRLIKSSEKGVLIKIERLPLSKELQRVCQKEKWDRGELALAGGEDYCLLLTVAAEAFKEISSAFEKEFKKPLFDIGDITPKPSEVLYQSNGQPVEVKYKHFTHF